MVHKSAQIGLVLFLVGCALFLGIYLLVRETQAQAAGMRSVPTQFQHVVSPLEKREHCASVYTITNRNTEVATALHHFYDDQEDIVHTLSDTMAGGASHAYDLGDIDTIPSDYSGYAIVSSDRVLTHTLDVCPTPGATPTCTLTPMPGYACYVALVLRAPSTPAPTPSSTPTPTVTGTPTITPTQTTTPPITSTPTEVPTGVLSIGYILYDASDEHIQIDNHGTSPQALGNWTIQSYTNAGGSCEPSSQQSYTFPEGYVLEPGAWVRVHSGPDATENQPSDLRWTRRYIWSDDGDVAVLHDGVGRIVDTYCYGGCCLQARRPGYPMR